jgi:hypothetical protein
MNKKRPQGSWRRNVNVIVEEGSTNTHQMKNRIPLRRNRMHNIVESEKGKLHLKCFLI